MTQRYRFLRTNRLLNAADYGRVFNRADRTQDRWFTVLFRERDSDDARLGLAISKKHCKKAASRNLIKRQVRESFRLHQQQLAGLDIVVLNKPGTQLGSRRQLRESLARHWDSCTRRRIKNDG